MSDPAQHDFSSRLRKAGMLVDITFDALPLTIDSVMSESKEGDLEEEQYQEALRASLSEAQPPTFKVPGFHQAARKPDVDQAGATALSAVGAVCRQIAHADDG